MKQRTSSLCLLSLAAACCTPTSSTAPGESWSSVSALNWPEPLLGGSGYVDAVRDAIWNEIYPEGGVELYCRTPFARHQSVDRMIGVEPLSLEHVYPAELIAKALGMKTRKCTEEPGGNPGSQGLCLAAVADAHNLWPAFGRLNQSRGTTKYGEIEGEGTSDERWIPFCEDFERQYAPLSEIVEPTSAARGDIARTLLYMHFVYELPLEDVVADRALLLEWHSEDLPDEMERQREDRIEAMRLGARNPLIPRTGH
jgi:deoxyribonuclease-1